MKLNSRKEGNTNVFSIEGEATAKNAVEIKNFLATGFLAAKEIAIEVEKLADVDLSFIQLLIALERDCASEKKPFMVKESEGRALIRSYASGLGLGDRYGL